MHILVFFIVLAVVYWIGMGILAVLNWTTPPLTDPMRHYPPNVRAYLERKAAKAAAEHSSQTQRQAE
jgi:hypothetical protein